MSPAVMLNAYFTCHNAADFLSIRPVVGVKRTSTWSKYNTDCPPLVR